MKALFTLYRPYIDEFYRASEPLGIYSVQSDTYKVHYRGLYDQPRLYQAKSTYLWLIRDF